MSELWQLYSMFIEFCAVDAIPIFVCHLIILFAFAFAPTPFSICTHFPFVSFYNHMYALFSFCLWIKTYTHTQTVFCPTAQNAVLHLILLNFFPVALQFLKNFAIKYSQCGKFSLLSTYKHLIAVKLENRNSTSI